jgi:DNA-binding PadR family transcriptional regulator
MFADNTLTPREAIRLCALGTLAAGAMRYSALANAVRHFVSRILGPSLDLMGTSIELLRLEGLVRAIDGTGMEDDARLEITDAGRRDLKALLTANIRPASTDLNKLIVALKFRFLHHLDEPERRAQLDLLVESCEKELARLEDLRAHHAGDPGALAAWLDHDIAAIERRIAWIEEFRASKP